MLTFRGDSSNEMRCELSVSVPWRRWRSLRAACAGHCVVKAVVARGVGAGALFEEERNRGECTASKGFLHPVFRHPPRKAGWETMGVWLWREFNASIRMRHQRTRRGARAEPTAGSAKAAPPAFGQKQIHRHRQVQLQSRRHTARIAARRLLQGARSARSCCSHVRKLFHQFTHSFIRSSVQLWSSITKYGYSYTVVYRTVYSSCASIINSRIPIEFCF